MKILPTEAFTSICQKQKLTFFFGHSSTSAEMCLIKNNTNVVTNQFLLNQINKHV